MVTVCANLIYTFLTHARLCWVHSDCLKNQQNSPVSGVKDYVLIGIPFFCFFLFLFLSRLMKKPIVREGSGRPSLALRLKKWEKRNAKLVLIKMLPIGNEWYCQEKKEGILHFVWEKQRKEKPNCFIKVLTYIQLKSLNLKSQMTHILAFLWKENYFPHGWLSEYNVIVTRVKRASA